MTVQTRTAGQPYAPIGAIHKFILLTVVMIPLLCLAVGIPMIWGTIVFGLDLVNRDDMIMLLIMYIWTGFGVTAGYHRMLTHKSFVAHPVVKFLLLVGGCMAVQSGPITWARIHLWHHDASDTDDDPHSPLRSFFHAHFGWMLGGYGAPPTLYPRHLKEDWMVQMFERTFVFWVVMGYVIPYLIAGWSGVFWGGFVRMCLGHHVTWSVNSVCHTFGKRMFNTNDMSRNQWVVGLLAFGEGWHNNHHAFQYSAFHGMCRWQFDGTGLLIRILEKLHLVDKVQRVPKERFEAELGRARREGTGVNMNIHLLDPATLK